MPLILKFWHKWSWLFHIGAWLVAATVYVCGYQNATADNTKQIALITEQRKDENVKERLARTEQAMLDIREDVRSIKDTESKIFQRLNHISDSE